MNHYVEHMWAKRADNPPGAWHPLILHLLDVAACADEALAREPDGTRAMMARSLGLDWEAAKSWLLLLVACHDIGKACPGFQFKWPDGNGPLTGSGLSKPRDPDTRINHGYVSQISLCDYLVDNGWPMEIADLSSDAVGSHHGQRGSPVKLETLRGNRNALGGNDWNDARKECIDILRVVFSPGEPPVKVNLTGPEYMLLAGLTSFSDWIGSSEEHFPFGGPADCMDLTAWWDKRRHQAVEAFDSIGWNARSPLCPDSRSLSEVFSYIPGFDPRPLQVAVADCVAHMTEPGVLLVEAPMGEGKTEAAFYAYLELQRKMGHRGLYVALPTKATGDAMFERTLEFLESMKPGQPLDLQLLHGASKLNDKYMALRFTAIDDPDGAGNVKAGEWFTHRKKALLSEYGVGTVDQALLTILPVRHHFMRLWGLANRVVVFDEVHAYDAYTGTLLLHLVQWLIALGSTVILLSATLPPRIRRKLALQMGAQPAIDTEYPRITRFAPGKVEQSSFVCDPARRREVNVMSAPMDVDSVRSCLEKALPVEGRGLFLLNTVQRAQELYASFAAGAPIRVGDQIAGKRLPDGTEVYLFHARFPADRRQIRERTALDTFGKKASRDGRRFLVATQVVEQSLDLDFDVMMTDLAPIDLVLQRAGRLWRHERAKRPMSSPCLYVSGLEGDHPPSFGTPIWWKYVYPESLLLRTWKTLKEKDVLNLPDDIDGLVNGVYEFGDEADELDLRQTEADEKDLGVTFAKQNQANQVFIGSPDDASWNDPARYVRADEDNPGLHPTLVAVTRLGKRSVTAVPILPRDFFAEGEMPDTAKAREWSLRSMSLTRQSVVNGLVAKGVPAGWKKSPLLRYSMPLILDEKGCWIEDCRVRLDDELGLIYGNVEVT